MKDGSIREYQVKMDVGFLLHAPKNESGDVGSARQEKKNKGRTRRARSTEAQAIARKGGRRAKGVARPFKQQ